MSIKLKSVHKSKNVFVYTSMIIEVNFDVIKIFEKINVLKKNIMLNFNIFNNWIKIEVRYKFILNAIFGWKNIFLF